MSIQEHLNRWRFEAAVRAILATPPVREGANPFAVLSMVHRRDVLAYLLAIKTFALYAQPARVVVVADPSLERREHDLIRRHVAHAEILPAEAFRRPALPRGGTWERLAAIAALNAETAIVQLDADTVTFGPPDEVVQAASAGRSFILRSEGHVEIVSLAAAAEEGRRTLPLSGHVQVAVEARLAELADAEQRRYVRGCSGFTGFGRAVLSPQLLDEVSLQMRALHRERWDEWGTEQVTSNLLAASAPGSFLLPHPRYCNADFLAPSTVFAHFIGYTRFKTRDYERRIGPARRTLSSAAASA